MKVLPAGYERRRRDLYGRSRRFLYGLLLLAAAPGAMAADELTYLGQYRAQASAAAPAYVVLATLQGLVMVHAEPAVDPGTPVGGTDDDPHLALDTVTARLPDPADAPLFRVPVSDRRQERDGVGFDLAVPDLGNFHLGLHARRDARAESRRRAVHAAGAQDGRICTVGGTLQLVRSPDGERHVALVPELVLDLSGAQTTYLPFQASLKRALDERVPQLAFEWHL